MKIQLENSEIVNGTIESFKNLELLPFPAAKNLLQTTSKRHNYS